LYQCVEIDQLIQSMNKNNMPKTTLTTSSKRETPGPLNRWGNRKL
jgi:hypothetical protein